jgi:hypothetical protein
VTPQQESDVGVLVEAMYVLSRYGCSAGASWCASVVSKIHADAAEAVKAATA